jgi:hypothetical protein
MLKLKRIRLLRKYFPKNILAYCLVEFCIWKLSNKLWTTDAYKVRINCTAQSPSSEQLLRRLRHPKVHCRIHKNRPQVPFTTQMKPVRTLIEYWRSSLILFSYPRLGLPCGLLTFGFPANILNAFLVSQCGLCFRNLTLGIEVCNKFGIVVIILDRLSGLVVRVLSYRSGGPGSIPGTTRKTNRGSGMKFNQPREYNWGATW